MKLSFREADVLWELALESRGFNAAVTVFFGHTDDDSPILTADQRALIIVQAMAEAWKGVKLPKPRKGKGN